MRNTRQRYEIGRRAVLSALGGSALGLLSAPAVHSQGKPVLRYLNNGVSSFDAIMTKAEADLGITIETTELSIYEVLRTMVTQPNAYDVVDTECTAVNQLRRLRRIQAIDSSRIPHTQSLSSVFVDGVVDGRRVSSQGDAPFNVNFLKDSDSLELSAGPTKWLSVVPMVHNADTLGIRPDLIDRPVTSWGDLFSEEFSGKTAIVGIPSIGILDAALAIESLGLREYGNKGQMTREEIDFTVGYLLDAKKRDHFAAIWKQFGESTELMANGDVVIQSMWSPAVTVVRQRGIPCTYQPLTEGYRGWAHGIALPSTLSGRNKDVAYEFINWCLDGWRGAFLQRQGYYSSVHQTAKAYMEPFEWDYWMNGKAAQHDVPGPDGVIVAKAGERLDGGSFDNRVGKIVCWNSHMDRARYLVKKWRAFAGRD